MPSRYASSERLLERARQTIPLGAQTFSKSLTQYPFSVSPYFAQRALGSKLWDVDGNEYVDFANALGAVTLGYADPDVNSAVTSQLAAGTIYSLSHPIEAEVAELICATVPCAEMVRFGKNGSDATAGAIRIARAFTGRDHVLVCGYHGWQDWYIGSTARNKGVPEATRALTHSFSYNNIAALDAKLTELNGQVAAVILEPMNITVPSPDYLEGVKRLAHKAGAVLVFDEIVTGFRFAQGGAQELFGVTPDLTTLGKGMSNGFPLSAVCGRREIMKEMEEVFFSFTMGGETLSLAAARTTIRKLLDEPVIDVMRSQGTRLKEGIAKLIEQHGFDSFMAISGDPTWTFLVVEDTDTGTSWEINTLLIQELLERGVISLGTHMMSYAHSTDDVSRLLGAYDETFSILGDAVRGGSIRSYLRCAPLKPLFRVR